MAIKTIHQKNKVSTLDLLKNKAGEFNKVALKASSEIVDETIATGEQWQNIFAKALKKGTLLFARQQDLALSSLEALKEQFAYGNKRTKKLFSPAAPKQKTATLHKTGSSDIDELMEAVLQEEKPVKKAAKPVPAKAVEKPAAAPTKKELPSATAKPTDLTVIEGIGPKIQELLNKAGIFTLEQLAAASPADLKTILTGAGTRYQMHDPSTWPAQAKLAAAGKRDELAALKAELKSGK
jgi:predicted flap endonuclease-1-like 5' DNA nuclease